MIIDILYGKLRIIPINLYFERHFVKPNANLRSYFLKLEDANNSVQKFVPNVILSVKSLPEQGNVFKTVARYV